MKAFFIGLLIAECCFLGGCQLKNKGQEPNAVVPIASLLTDSLLSGQDTTQARTARSLSTQGWSAKEIRDSIERFFTIDTSLLPEHLLPIRRNIISLWNTDSAIYLTLIQAGEEQIQAFRKYVFDSPRIKIEASPCVLPQGILLQDSTLFQMHVTPNVYPTTAEQIEISITNNGDREGMAGENQAIEYLDGNKWVGLPQNPIVNAIGYPIAPGEIRDGFVVSLNQDVIKNRAGLYRVYKGVNIGRGKSLTQYVVSAPFYLSDNPDEYKDYTHFTKHLYTPRHSPEFKGGREALIRFLQANLRYPETYEGTGTEVRLFYSFTIDSKGKLQDPVCEPSHIVYPKDTDQTFDEFRAEALRVLHLMPAWEPAVNRIHGPVSSLTGLSFIFREDLCRVHGFFI